MRDENFMHAVNEICAFLGSKEIPAHTKAAWFQKVQDIPDESLPYIVAKITDEVDAMPATYPRCSKRSFGPGRWRTPARWQSLSSRDAGIVKAASCSLSAPTSAAMSIRGASFVSATRAAPDIWAAPPWHTWSATAGGQPRPKPSGQDARTRQTLPRN